MFFSFRIATPPSHLPSSLCSPTSSFSLPQHHQYYPPQSLQPLSRNSQTCEYIIFFPFFIQVLLQSQSKSPTMAREGTRSSTGHSKPRVFETVDTAPAISRKPRAKTSTKKAGAKPTGVTKKAGRPKKEGSVATKAKAAVKKVEAKVKKATSKPKAKPKTVAK